MRRKLPRFFLLSFLSFCFWFVLFQTIAANAQAGIVQNPEKVPPSQIVPTPTIYIYVQPSPSSAQTLHENISVPSPTPTIFVAPSQQTKEVVSPTPEQTQIYDTTEQPAVSPTDTPTVTPTPIVDTTPQPTVQDDPANLEALFSEYSTQYNVSADELKKIAQCESGFNTNSNTGTYAGMYQFLASTWESERAAMGVDPNPDLRMDPGAAIQTAAFMLSRGGENAWPNCH